MHARKRLPILLLLLILSVSLHSANGQRRPPSKRQELFRKLTEAVFEFFGALRDLAAQVSERVRPYLKPLADAMRGKPKAQEKPVKPEPDKLDKKEEKKEAKPEVHDCFGLGPEVAETLETWMKGDANSTEDVKVKFHIRSNKISERRELSESDKSDLEKIDFDIRRRTFFVIHGYLSSSDAEWIPPMEDALLKLGDGNVITVDWSGQHFALNYFKVARSTETVGNQIATFLHDVSTTALEKQGIPKESWGPLHFIGHSLGSHISGYTAHEVKRRNGDWQVQRITGLDPAKLCFENSEENLKLDKGDAPFVDVIHTNAKNSLTEGLSLFKPIGHLDFYPNGGKHQPGCTESNFILPDSIKLPKRIINEAVCNHGKSYMYFTESILNSIAKNCTFWAKPWDMTEESAGKMLWDSCDPQSCIEMGINSEAYYPGNSEAFFVLTSGEPPFCSVTKREEVAEVKKILEDNKDDGA
ncbi:pancreatic triacylglycerol lipase-like isoform X2 [Nasonia vitripennis]|uniref:phospholipase A1 n=1 Tax=Nasonia vitripennis TaxID=7425 RepID=A0A7M7H806_NASVI|nr:pancreatic triacylglycerol lipase-like isoform X2 [Nasonia vitripennis]